MDWLQLANLFLKREEKKLEMVLKGLSEPGCRLVEGIPIVVLKQY
jgi:hypothetical protein